MGGGGSMAAMNQSLSENKKLRKRKSTFKKNKGNFNFISVSGKKLSDLPKMSATQKKQFISDLEQEKHKSTIRQILILGIIVVGFSAVVSYLLLR